MAEPDRERIAQALRWLGSAVLLYPAGRAIVDPAFAALNRPVPGIASRAVAALYLAIPAAAIVLARRIPSPRARHLLYIGAALSLLGLALEWAPVRFESFVGALFSFANDATINVGVAVFALALIALDMKPSTFARRSTVVLEGSFALTVGILVEIAWTRVRPAASSEHGGLGYVLGQIAFVAPLLLLAIGSFVRARLIREEGLEASPTAIPERGHLLRLALVAIIVAGAFLAVGEMLFTARHMWTLGATAAFAVIAIRTSRQS